MTTSNRVKFEAERLKSYKSFVLPLIFFYEVWHAEYENPITFVYH